MEVFGISILIVVCGIIGYVWKLRNTITKLIPSEKDDEFVDTVEGIANSLNLDLDKLATKSSGKLKQRVKKKL